MLGREDSATLPVGIEFGKGDLTHEQMYTSLVAIEGILNNRPLTYVSADGGELEAITPGHFIMSGPATDLEGPGENDNISSRWKQVQRLQQRFWHRFVDEYVPTLNESSPRAAKEGERLQDVQVDDVVVFLEHKDRGCWPLARVHEVQPGQDGRVRTVILQTIGWEKLKWKTYKHEKGERVIRYVKRPANLIVPVRKE